MGLLRNLAPNPILIGNLENLVKEHKNPNPEKAPGRREWKMEEW